MVAEPTHSTMKPRTRCGSSYRPQPTGWLPDTSRVRPRPSTSTLTQRCHHSAPTIAAVDRRGSRGTRLRPYDDVRNEHAARYGLPLTGIRIVAVEQVVSLPTATQLLARLGADVVKIEPIEGDKGRRSAPTEPGRD